RMACHGQAPDRLAQRARPPGDRRLSAAHRAHLRRDQSRRRSALHRARSARAARRSARMNGAIAAAAPSREVFASFARDRVALASLIVLALIVFAALFAPFILPQNPYNLAELDILDPKLAPGGLSVDRQT